VLAPQGIGVQVPSSAPIAASHTHESLAVFIHGGEPTPIQVEEIEHIRKGAVEAARRAAANLQPARIAFARGEAFVNINNGEEAGLKTWYDAKGPSDKTLGVVRVENAKGEPLALLVNYATHAETMFRSVDKDGGYEVSGDIPGAVSRILEANAAGAPVVLYMAGAEADQLPLFKSLQPEAGGLPAADEGAAGWALLDVMARRLSGSVLETLAGMKPGASDVKLQVASNSVTCPGQHTRVDNQTGQITKQDGPPVIIPLSAIRINDIGIVAVAGDIGSDIGKDIRAGSPVPNMIVTSQMAGAVGYILSDASYAHPGHGLAGSPLKEGCAEQALPQGIATLLSGGSK
jgi:neutral ceramidase